MQNISEELAVKFVKSKGLYDIKYLTSKAEAMEVKLIDYDYLRAIDFVDGRIRKDTSIKKKKC